MRDRLIELVSKAREKCNLTNCCDCEYRDAEPLTNCYSYLIADQLLESGVIVPPVKVGDMVYTNISMQGWYYRTKDRPYTGRIVFIGVNDSEEMGCGYINVLYDKDQNMLQFRISDIGKTVFLTREEAEQALKGEHHG